MAVCIGRCKCRGNPPFKKRKKKIQTQLTSSWTTSNVTTEVDGQLASPSLEASFHFLFLCADLFCLGVADHIWLDIIEAADGAIIVDILGVDVLDHI